MVEVDHLDHITCSVAREDSEKWIGPSGYRIHLTVERVIECEAWIQHVVNQCGWVYLKVRTWKSSVVVMRSTLFFKLCDVGYFTFLRIKIAVRNLLHASPWLMARMNRGRSTRALLIVIPVRLARD